MSIIVGLNVHHSWSAHKMNSLLLPKVLLLMPVAFLFTLSISSADSTIKDLQWLLLFKQSIACDPYSVLSSWESNASSACSWTGITCSSQNGRVESIQLRNYSLFGTIPDDIQHVSFLQILDLSFNYLHGSIPASLGNLPNIRFISLAVNGLHGYIPAELGNLKSLLYLDLSSNNFSGGIPSSFGKLSNLQVLNISDNPDVGGEIPAALGRLKRLERLRLHRSGITGSVPITIGNCSSLVELDLFGNSLHGRIPGSLADLSSLELLDLSSNYLESGVLGKDPATPLFQAFRCSSNLKSLRLQKNRLGGVLPANFGSALGRLEEMSLAHNAIRGSIPSGLGSMKSLLKLDLSHNRFSGSIPKELVLLNKTIQIVDVSSNILSGSIPAGIRELKLLRELILRDNLLSDQIPADIAYCESLERLDLSRNNLSGEITLQMMQSVKYLNLSYNNLSGVIPDFSGNKHVEVIDLSHNHFTGIRSLKNSHDFSSANFSSNDFNAQIPPRHRVSSTSSGSPSASKTITPLSKRNQRSRATAILASCIGAFICLAVLLALTVFVLRKKSGKKSQIAEITFTLSKFPTVTEQELKFATNNFSEENFLGKGNFALLYRGVLAQGQSVTVKTFAIAEEKEKAQRSFLRECQSLGKIRHRNLIKIITACSSDSIKALVLPSMANGSLETLLYRPIDRCGTLLPLHFKTRLRILKEIASALSYLHHDCKPAIIHCDVRPPNVLLDQDMTAHLSEFGMARVLDRDDLKETLLPEPPVGYTPPEHARRPRVGPAGDAFSFGVLTLEVLTRTRPTHPMVRAQAKTLRAWVCMALEGSDDLLRERVLRRNCQRGIGVEKEDELGAFRWLLELGLRCTSERGDRRPSMRHVERRLHALSAAFPPS